MYEYDDEDDERSRGRIAAVVVVAVVAVGIGWFVLRPALLDDRGLGSEGTVVFDSESSVPAGVTVDTAERSTGLSTVAPGMNSVGPPGDAPSVSIEVAETSAVLGPTDAASTSSTTLATGVVGQSAPTPDSTTPAAPNAPSLVDYADRVVDAGRDKRTCRPRGAHEARRFDGGDRPRRPRANAVDGADRVDRTCRPRRVHGTHRFDGGNERGREHDDPPDIIDVDLDDDTHLDTDIDIDLDSTTSPTSTSTTTSTLNHQHRPRRRQRRPSGSPKPPCLMGVRSQRPPCSRTTRSR